MIPAATASGGLRLDRWLSDLLSRPAWSIAPTTSDPAAAVREAGEGPAFFFTRVPCEDVSTLTRFEDVGFRIVDTTVTLEVDRESLLPGDMGKARFAKAGDKAQVMAIAANAFERSRFHLDPRIPRPIANRSRAEWVGNFFSGSRGDALVVAADGNDIAAFLLLLGPQDGVLTIDLVAAKREARSLGLGSACIRFASSHIPGVSRLRVGTQVANVGSLRFYERLGFRAVSSQYALHLHRA